MSKKNQNYTNRKQNRFLPERMRGNVFVNNSGKQWLPGENGRAAKVERLLKGAREEKKEIAGNMAGYKDSEVEYIGKLPNTWNITKLKYVSDIYTATAHPFFGKDENHILAKNDKSHNIYEEWTDGGYDVIITGRVGTIGQYQRCKNSYLNKILNKDNRLIVKPKSDQLNKSIRYDYLFYGTLIINLQDIISGSAVPLITATGLSKKEIPLPPLPEQQRIADFLDTKCGILDRTIDAVSRQIEDLEKYKKALITKTVTKGICKKGEPERAMKDSGVEWIGEIPKEWKVSKVKHETSFIGSGTTPRSSCLSFYENGTIPWIQSGDLYETNEVTDTKQKITSEALRSSSALKVYDKDFIAMAMYGSIGNIAISRIAACVNQACCCLRPNARNNLNYMYYFLKASTDNFKSKAMGAVLQNISQEKIKNQDFLVPPLAEQQQIADYLDEKCKNIDKRVQKRKQQLEWLKEYKKSLIFDYVTGKKRV